jgi:hypothetical protein
MAVPVHERGEAKLSFLDNAELLENLTADIIMNDKYVPKKYRYVWSQNVFQLSMRIFENVRRANILYPSTVEIFKARMKYLQLAESDAEALLTQIAFARKRFSIPSGLFEQWEKVCVATKRAIRARAKSDYEIGKKKLKIK